ncbi:hypothetical protein N7462_006430 [Penicillium macrosclerotiorum]|uniref:uncharacterized protein n=1 Tax=Penicillium macrosclerotiorum TaxID=303699 RepID=UPI002548A6EC|nr:uncharacterized protein N7462_006430 [Penicillium macrosclerotiorum]KAJ5683265.1 hypothetical protein N7462_006430 [Penicillium macrosclerotiorum]
MSARHANLRRRMRFAPRMYLENYPQGPHGISSHRNGAKSGLGVGRGEAKESQRQIGYRDTSPKEVGPCNPWPRHLEADEAYIAKSTSFMQDNA